MSCHCLLQEIFPTQGLNPGLPHCRQTLYRLSHQCPFIPGPCSCPWFLSSPILIPYHKLNSCPFTYFPSFSAWVHFFPPLPISPSHSSFFPTFVSHLAPLPTTSPPKLPTLFSFEHQVLQAAGLCLPSPNFFGPLFCLLFPLSCIPSLEAELDKHKWQRLRWADSLHSPNS